MSYITCHIENVCVSPCRVTGRDRVWESCFCLCVCLWGAGRKITVWSESSECVCLLLWAGVLIALGDLDILLSYISKNLGICMFKIQCVQTSILK